MTGQESSTSGEYEMVDPMCFVKSKNVDVDLVTFLPTNAEESKEITYENAVALAEADVHTYEAPNDPGKSQKDRSRPRSRARINELYEGFDYDKPLSKAMICETIRNLDPDSSHKKREPNRPGFFVLSSLIIHSLLVLGAFGYVFYKVQFQQESSTCRCTTTQPKDQSISDVENDVKQQISEVESNCTRKIAALMKKIDSLQTKLDSVESQQKTQINNALRRYWHQNIDEIKMILHNKTSNLAKSLNLTMATLSKANLTLGKYFEETINATNKGFNKEISQLNQKLAARGSFKSCTVKNRANWFPKESERAWVFVDEKKEYKIVGVTCVSRLIGEIQDSWLEPPKFKYGKRRYQCGCKISHNYDFKTVNGTNSQCIMYYWQCPNT